MNYDREEFVCGASSGATKFHFSNATGSISAKVISSPNGCRLLEADMKTRTYVELPFLAWAHGDKETCAILATRRLKIVLGIAVKYPDETVEDHLGQIWPFVGEWLNSLPK